MNLEVFEDSLGNSTRNEPYQEDLGNKQLYDLRIFIW